MFEGIEGIDQDASWDCWKQIPVVFSAIYIYCRFYIEKPFGKSKALALCVDSKVRFNSLNGVDGLCYIVLASG